eukprot:5678277-Ditylum_brightwellii.AAC.1
MSFEEVSGGGFISVDLFICMFGTCPQHKQGQPGIGLVVDVLLTYWLASGKIFCCDEWLTYKYATV